jgi:hypothetical protein
VTIVSGFMTGGAVILSADSQEVVSDYSKTTTQKIRITEFFGNWRLGIAGSGEAGYIDLFQQDLRMKLSTIHDFEYAKITSVIKATIHQLHKKHIWPHTQQKPVVQFLIAIQGIQPTPSRGLFVTNDSALLGVTEYQSIGIGSYMADYIKEQLYPGPGAVYNTPTEVVANMAVLMLQQVKKAIHGCDGESLIAIFSGDGNLRWMTHDEVQEIEGWMDKFHTTQLPMLMTVANPRARKDVFEIELETLRGPLRVLKNEQDAAVKARDEWLRQWSAKGDKTTNEV